MTRGRMQDEMINIVRDGGWFNWSFWEYDRVRPGDVCYMVRCGDSVGPHGMMLRGHIFTDPYVSEDWSGRGRVIHYADWYPEVFIDTEKLPPLTPGELERIVPGVNWRGGHSGRPLPPEFAEALDRAWFAHVESLLDKWGDGLELNERANDLSDGMLDFWKVINKK